MEVPTKIIESPEINRNPDNIATVRNRKIENLHIVFWLFKDLSWCMIWKPLGLLMIMPTMVIAVVITWRTRLNVSEVCHNLAVTAWITANSYWMVSEFFYFDELIVIGKITYRHLTLIPFIIGIGCLAYYYIFWKPRHSENLKTV